jgi:hypothetical protein
LDLLTEDANVYKLIGPVLVKQDLAEANANVRKRIEYISAELYASDALLHLLLILAIRYDINVDDSFRSFFNFAGCSYYPSKTTLNHLE